jgi:peroxiredoxin
MKAHLYGCWNEAAAIAERLTVVVDADGNITYVEHNSPPQIGDQKKAVLTDAAMPPSSARRQLRCFTGDLRLG